MKLTAGSILCAVFLLASLLFWGCAGLRPDAETPAMDQTEAGSDPSGGADVGAAEMGSGPSVGADAGAAEAGSDPSGDAGAGTAETGSDPSGGGDAGTAEAGSGPSGGADAGAAEAGSAPSGGGGAGAAAEAGSDPSGGAGTAVAGSGSSGGADAETAEAGSDPSTAGVEGGGDAEAPVTDGEEGTEGEKTGEEIAEEEPGITPEQKIVKRDIETSSLLELAAWCRSLGLSEGGGREQLAERLRAYYELPPPSAPVEEVAGEPGKKSKRKDITIESARSIDYFTLEAVDEEYARLRGGVVVTLKDGDASYRIQAEEILFNRTRNIISASGGVEFFKDDGNTQETFRGERITVELDNWASVFMDSVSERSSESDDSVFRFSGSLITRSGEKSTILKDAVITNGAEEETFWSINASRVWLLPGNDWAFLNAVLKVGEIPVLWLPAFFYPSDEVIFHPTFGYRTREGNFVQTTTYVFGRPKASSSSEASSITKLMGGNSDDEKEQQGMFLRSTGRKSQDPNDKRLSFLLDFYSNLGIYAGTEFALPSTGILRSINISGGLGFTRDVYQLSGGTYTPFIPQSGDSSEWNSSSMFSLNVPFRYRLDSSASFTLPGGSLSLTLPFYSDIYVNRDFLDRSEEMDWFNMIKQGNNTTTETSLTDRVLGYYDWRISGSFNPRVDFLNPYVSSFSISSISSTLAFRYRNKPQTASNVSPSNSFFFPDKLTLITVNSSIQGTLLSLGENKSAAANTSETEPEYEDPFKGIGVPFSPWKESEENKTETSGDLPYEIKPPALSSRFDVPLPGGSHKFTMNYRISPSGVSEMQFRSSEANWPNAEDVDWSEISSILNTAKADGNLSFNLQSPQSGFYTVGLQVNGSGAWQDYGVMNTEAEEFDTVLERNAALRRNYSATNFNTTGEGTFTVKPFFQNSVFSNTSFQYSLRGLLAKSVFTDKTLAAGEEIGDPEYTIEYGDWTKEKLDTHTARAQISASIMDYSQNLSMAFALPPKDSSLDTSATMRIWISDTSFSQKITEPFDEEKRVLHPMTFTETLKLKKDSTYNFSQSVIYDPELDDFTSLNSSLRLNFVTLTYTMSRYKPYELTDQGWVIKPATSDSFNPREFRVAYSQSYPQRKFWKDRISFNFNAGSTLVIDFQRYTYSKFTFNFGFTLGITKFLDLSFTTSSENAVIFRYMQDLPFFDFNGELPGEKNVFVDLLNSFRFDDETLRRASGFKLKSFSLSMTHHLGDWNAKLDWRLSPYLDTDVSPPAYKFNNEISFVVQWIPIAEAKTEIIYNKDVFEVK